MYIQWFLWFVFGIFVFVSLGLWIVMRLCLWFWVVVNCDYGLSIIGRGPRDPKAGLGANKKTRLEPNLLPFLTPADFPILRDLRRLTFGFSFSKASRFHLSDPHFGCFSLCHFPKWVDSFLPSWKIRSHLPSWFIFLGSPRYQTLTYELLVPKSSDPFFASLGGW